MPGKHTPHAGQATWDSDPFGGASMFRLLWHAAAYISANASQVYGIICRVKDKESKPIKPTRKRGVWVKIALLSLAAAAVALVALVFFAPAIVTRIDYPELCFDVSTNLSESAAALFTNKTVTAKIRVSQGYDAKLAVHIKGRALDWPFTASANIDWKWRLFGLDLAADAAVRIDGSPWNALIKFNASSSGEWNASVEMPQTVVDANDPVTSSLLSRLDLKGVTDISYGATVSFKADAFKQADRPCPEWSASARVKGCDISLASGETPVKVAGLQFGAGAKGIADHVDISPMFPCAALIEGSGLSLSNVFASVRATEASFLVTEAGAKFCGGDLRLYSFFLNPARLNAGLTLFIDGLDAGETLRHIKGFNGEASGRLHGKLPLYIKNGCEVKLGEAYLFSTPGETGTIKLSDPEPLVENLALAGVQEDSRENLARALANLAYTALGIRLTPEDKDSMALSLKLDGSSTHGETTVPVSFNVTFHGDLEQILNTGIKASTGKLKGNRK